MTNLKIGNIVPDFSAKDQDGNVISNKTLINKKYILFFYGQDDTPTCTKQVCAANDVVTDVKNHGYLLFGVSPDRETKHKKFIDKYNLTLNLLSDPEKKMMYAFEAYGPKVFMGKDVIGVYRKSYFIDEHGKIIHIIAEVTAAEQGRQIMEYLNMNERNSF